jgi:hypothetical protein
LGRAGAGGGPPTSRRGARSAQVSLAGSVGPSPSHPPAPLPPVRLQLGTS